MENLWGGFKPKRIETPNSILETAIKQLKIISNKVVYAELNELKITPFDLIKSYKFNFDFSIKSKYLESYSFRAFSVHYDIIAYPLNLKIDSSIKEDIKDKLIEFKKDITSNIIIIDNENEFIEILKTILQSKRMEEIINTLENIQF